MQTCNGLAGRTSSPLIPFPPPIFRLRVMYPYFLVFCLYLTSLSLALSPLRLLCSRLVLTCSPTDRISVSLYCSLPLPGPLAGLSGRASLPMSPVYQGLPGYYTPRIVLYSRIMHTRFLPLPAIPLCKRCLPPS